VTRRPEVVEAVEVVKSAEAVEAAEDAGTVEVNLTEAVEVAGPAEPVEVVENAALRGRRTLRGLRRSWSTRASAPPRLVVSPSVASALLRKSRGWRFAA